jgi:tetratricopeptide (TPR) repeat protein
MTVSIHSERGTVDDELQKLGILIDETERSIIAFALFQSVTEREAAVRDLKERLSVPVKEFTLSSEQQNPIQLLLSVPNDERAVVFFYNAEDALPRLAGYLNLQRETFLDTPHAVVFWVGEWGLREITTLAPDFWSWSSGTFDIRFERTEERTPVVDFALGEPQLGFEDKGDLLRLVSWYQGMIEEYSQEENPDNAFIGRLYARLAYYLFLVGRLADAEDNALAALKRAQEDENLGTAVDALGIAGRAVHRLRGVTEAKTRFAEALAISEEHNMPAKAATMSYLLGAVDLRQGRIDDAERWQRKALDIVDRLGFEGEAALSFHELGHIAAQRFQFDDAERWHQKALDVFDRLGWAGPTASCYHSLGEIARLRRRLDDAEGWYKKALKIQERLGLDDRAASSYGGLGRLSKTRGDLDKAEMWYRKALEIYQRLGLHQDIADEYEALGELAELRDQPEETERWYQKAREISEQTP